MIIACWLARSCRPQLAHTFCDRFAGCPYDTTRDSSTVKLERRRSENRRANHNVVLSKFAICMAMLKANVHNVAKIREAGALSLEFVASQI